MHIYNYGITKRQAIAVNWSNIRLNNPLTIAIRTTNGNYKITLNIKAAKQYNKEMSNKK